MANNKINLLRSGEIIKPSGLSQIHKVLASILNFESFVDATKYSEEENFWIISFNNFHFILAIEVIAFCAIGKIKKIKSLNIFDYAILRNAKYVILAHNRPIIGGRSPKLTPSDADFRITDQLYHFGKAIEIPVLDHLIITEKKYVSCEEIGMMDDVDKSLEFVITKEVQKEIDVQVKELQKKSYDKGIEKGRIEGEKSGFKKGEKSGLYTKAIQIAKNMKREGCDIDTIVKWTGLNKEEIKKL